MHPLVNHQKTTHHLREVRFVNPLVVWWGRSTEAIHPRTKFSLLRYALLLPLDTPYLNELEAEVGCHNINTRYIHFRIFEYQTIQQWKSDDMTGKMKDKLFRTNQAVHSFFRTAYSFSSFISQEDRKSTFIFGEALMQIERRFEAHRTSSNKNSSS